MLYKFCMVIALLLTSSVAIAQQPPIDLVDKVIADLFRRQSGMSLCMPQGASRESVRAALKDRLNGLDTNNDQNANAIAIAVYTTFPCPFSPYRNELRRATEKDIEGVWLYPETSQKLRFGPKSSRWSKNAAMPIKCESVAFYPAGEARTVQIVGQQKACFSSAKNMDVIHQSNPKVESWQMIKEGMVKISRTDVPNHIEEWEAFSVVKPFEMWKVQFKEGDLLAFQRRETGNDFNAATVFRHLQRLPKE
jgi:hypothetical protein